MIARVRDERGYTLAELLVVAATVGLVMAGLFSLLASGQQSYVVGTNRAEAQQNARLVIARMVQELRTAGHDPRVLGNFAPVTALAAGNTGFVIRNDWNANGVIDAGITVAVDGVNRGEQVTYTFAGTTLTRQESGVDAGAVTVTTAVNSVAIRYLDAADVAVATPSGVNASLIRTVEIDVTTDPDTVSSGYVFKTASTVTNRVRVRNR